MRNSNDTSGNRTRDLPACSAVPQPTARPRAPKTRLLTLKHTSGVKTQAIKSFDPRTHHNKGECYLYLRHGSKRLVPKYSLSIHHILYLNHLRIKMQGNESQEFKMKPSYNGNIRGRIVFR